MPQASEELRLKFFKYNDEGDIIDDGILAAEKIITDAGGIVRPDGVIFYSYDKNMSEEQVNNISDAIDWLCNEWDYGWELKNE